MPVPTTLKDLEFDEALAALDEGAAFVDLRPVADYLDVHIPGSIELCYEFGPGLASRARDCLPLSLPLILLDLGTGDISQAAAALKGKGFPVVGSVRDGINRWASAGGRPVSTDVVTDPEPPPGTALDVGDPGAPRVEGSIRIPVDRLWVRAEEIVTEKSIVVVAGYGVRAALAVGVLERMGARRITFWWIKG